ncbi:MAG: YggL family protein [Comamonadaceae bacterium]|nr:YggL family protein [Comamonadaceae bacterium]
MGFDVETELKAPLAGDAEEQLLIAFIEEVIEPRGLIYGGSVDCGYVCKAGGGSVTEEDRSTVKQWLESRSEFSAVTVRELSDAWYASLTA